MKVKKILKNIGKAVLSISVIKKSSRFILAIIPISHQKRYNLRGIMESMCQEEILKSKRGFYFPNRNIIGLYADEFSEWDDFSLLKEPKVIVEVGANIGIDTIALAQKFPKAKIIAIEPCDKYRKILEMNVKGLNVEIYDYFLSSQNNEVELNINSSSATVVENISSSFPTLEKQKVKSKKLDDLDLKFDLLKIDTDGWDEMVIRGGINSILKQKPQLFAELSGAKMPEGLSNESFLKLLDSMGYKNFVLLDRPNSIKAEGYKNLISLLKPDSSVDFIATM